MGITSFMDLKMIKEANQQVFTVKTSLFRTNFEILVSSSVALYIQRYVVTSWQTVKSPNQSSFEIFLKSFVLKILLQVHNEFLLHDLSPNLYQKRNIREKKNHFQHFYGFSQDTGTTIFLTNSQSREITSVKLPLKEVFCFRHGLYHYL